MSKFFNPYELRNAHSAAFSAPPLLPTVKVETALGDAYTLHRQGMRSETSQDIIFNSGEIETSLGNAGDYYRFNMPVVNETESYTTPIDMLDNGAGATALVPIVDQVYETAEIPYSFDPADAYSAAPPPPIYESAYSIDDLIAWDKGYVPPETAPTYYVEEPAPVAYYAPTPTYYQPETAAPFYNPAPVEQVDPAQAQQDAYQQALNDYLAWFTNPESDPSYDPTIY